MKFGKFIQAILAVPLVAACGFEHQGTYSSTLAADLPAHCSHATAIDRPLIDDNAASGKFTYRYRVITRGKDLPTLVYLPGGPGDTSLDLGESEAILKVLFPDAFNILLTESRGIGCNLLPEQIPEGTISTEMIASDVAAAIEQEHLGNFVVFGWSYGTTLATVLSSKLEDQQQPRAYLLQGTLGKHFGEEFDPYVGFQREWEHAKRAMSPVTLAQFSAATLPLGLSAADWAAFIDKNLLIKDEGAPPLEQQLAAVNGDDAAKAALKAAVLDVVSSNNDLPQGLERLYKTLFCTELSQTDNGDFALIDGHLVGKQDPSFCAGRPMTHAFDSRSYALRSPIFYLQGKDDPATTLENAHYHFDGQSGSPRFFITVEKGAHFPFSRLTDCRDGLWKSVAAQGAAISEVLAQCGAHPQLETKDANAAVASNSGR